MFANLMAWMYRWAHREDEAYRNPIPSECFFCGKTFEPKHPGQFFCTEICAELFRMEGK